MIAIITLQIRDRIMNFYVKSLNSFLTILSYGSSTPLSNTMYDILKVMGKDAEFLYDTIDTYINDAQKANKVELVETWNKIKSDRLGHINMLKEALEKEIHGN